MLLFEKHSRVGTNSGAICALTFESPDTSVIVQRRVEKGPQYCFIFVFCQGKQGLPGLLGEPVSILALYTCASCLFAFPPLPQLLITVRKEMSINRQRQLGRIKRSPEFLHRPSVMKFKN